MKYLLLLILLASFTILNCFAGSRYEVLSFFFDGVPDPAAVQIREKAQTDSLMKISQVMQEDLKNLPGKTIEKNTTSFHLPYQQKKCKSCHLSMFSNKLPKPAEELCYDCHPEFSRFPGYTHGPVAVGGCIFCHGAHTTPNPSLLLQKDDDVCLFCHEHAGVIKTGEHRLVYGTGCIRCHNPHYSEDSKFFLRKAGQTE